jgi:threonine/homoserine/homoserine lactone efflux protein
MIVIIIKGLLIGLCVSVPVGPIGMLIIQRTFNRGRAHGIATGLGATFSDLLYTIIALFFLSFVIDFIDEYKKIIQFVGSLLVVAFGVYTYRSHPHRIKSNDTKKHSLFGDFMTSFGLTFSNPLVLFLLIALFARFQFIDNQTTFLISVIGIFSILIGALLWWSVLTYLVSHFKSRVNTKGLIIINRLTGSIIMIIGCVGIVLCFIQ